MSLLTALGILYYSSARANSEQTNAIPLEYQPDIPQALTIDCLLYTSIYHDIIVCIVRIKTVIAVIRIDIDIATIINLSYCPIIVCIALARFLKGKRIATLF